MRAKRVVSLILSLALVLSCMAFPATAAVDYNSAGGGISMDAGKGGASKAWSLGNVKNRSGYR